MLCDVTKGAEVTKTTVEALVPSSNANNAIFKQEAKRVASGSIKIDTN